MLAVVVALVCGRGLEAIAAEESRIARMTEEGSQPRTGTFSVLPWESIDMLSGNGVLSWTDLALPGNAGLELRIQRVLNLNTRQWRIGVPGPVAVVLEVGGSQPVENPIIEYLDGGREYTFRSLDNADVYYTIGYARFHKASRTLELPDGLVYHFDKAEPASTWRVTSIADSFGNTITFAYDGTTTTIGQDLGEQARTVVLSQPLGGDWTLSFNGRTWTYRISGAPGWMSEAVAPDGLWWQHTLTPIAAGPSLPDGGHLVEVTTPNGGMVRYTVRRWSGTSSGERYTVWMRESLGRDVAPGLWRFRYDTTTSPYTSYAAGPGAVLHTYSHAACEAAEVYLNRVVFTSHTVSSGTILENGSVTAGPPLEVTGHAWSCLGNFQADRVGSDLPLPTGSSQAEIPYERAVPILSTGTTITRGAHAFSRSRSYSAGLFNQYGHPDITEETGTGVPRSIALTYKHLDTAPYIVGLLASEEVTSDGWIEASSSWSYDTQTGFMWSETIRGITTTFQRTPRGNVARTTDATDRTLDYVTPGREYVYGQPPRRDTATSTTERVINPSGTVHSETRRGFTTTFEYDGLDREILRTPPVGRPTVTSHSSTETTITRGDRVTHVALDGYGRPTLTTDPAGVKTLVAYDAWGRVVFRSDPYAADPAGGTRTTYDPLGRVIDVRRTAVDDDEPIPGPEGQVTTYAYDGLNVAITAQTADASMPDGLKARVTRQTWTAVGAPSAARLSQVLDAEGHETTYRYDLLGNLTQVLQVGVPPRMFHYSDRGLMDWEAHPESGRTDYGYDGAGRLETKTEAAGTAEHQATTYHYDADGRLATIDYPGTADDVQIHYDASDNRTGVTNGSASIHIDFDGANRPFTQTTTLPDGGTFTVGYWHDSYDALRQIQYPSQRVVNYDVDTFGRVSRVWTPGAAGDKVYADTFVHHPSGAIQSYRLGNGVTQAVEYDGRQRPQTIRAGDALHLTYGYDQVGNVTAIEDARPGFSQAFKYDHLDRLREASGPWPLATYHYDPAGHLDVAGGPGGSRTFTINANTQRVDAITGSAPESLTYSQRGELRRDRLGAYTYTPGSMLARADMDAGVTLTYRYDGDNRRVRSAAGSGAPVLFVHDIASRVLSEYTFDGAVAIALRDHIYVGSRLIASSTSCGEFVPEGAWHGEYWASPTPGLAGTGVLVRNHGAGALNLGWGTGSPNPACGVPADHFSARFTRTIATSATETLTFTLASDNGARLYVETPTLARTLLIDTWGTPITAPAPVSQTLSGPVTVTVE